MNNITVPIVIFTYRRTIDKTIQSLLENKLARDCNLYIFSDGSKNENDFKDVQEVRKYLKTIKGFKSINIIESSENKGLANSIINGVTNIVNKYDKVIVLEDDLLVSCDFLDYMNCALDFYENDKKIWSISGYGPKLSCFENFEDDLYLSTRASSWGWATWKGRWNMIDWEVKDWNSFKKNKEAIANFEKGGNDMFKMLELQMLGEIDSWAIRWCYSQFSHNMYSVYPKKSKIINDGFNDNKGTHNNGKNNKLTLELDNNRVDFKELHLEQTMVEYFKKFHDLTFKTRIGYFLKKHGGYNIIKKILKVVKL